MRMLVVGLIHCHSFIWVREVRTLTTSRDTAVLGCMDIEEQEVKEGRGKRVSVCRRGHTLLWTSTGTDRCKMLMLVLLLFIHHLLPLPPPFLPLPPLPPNPRPLAFCCCTTLGFGRDLRLIHPLLSSWSCSFCRSISINLSNSSVFRGRARPSLDKKRRRLYCLRCAFSASSRSLR